MRSYIVFALLLSMLAGFGVLLARRARPTHEVSYAEPDRAPRDQGTRPGTVPAEGAAPTRARDSGPAGAADAGPEPADARAAQPEGPQKLMDRPLRVVGLGWDLLAPGLVANRGSAPGEGSRFSADGLDVRVASVAGQVDLERALARGGAEVGGADIAVMPLPAFVAAAERLRALDPRIFLVVGWSHGREALHAASGETLSRPPQTGPVRVVGEEGTTAVFLATAVLDLAGVSPSRVVLVSPRDAAAALAPLAAVERASGSPATESDRRLVLTTADAARLVPYVAIAPRGFVESRGAPLRAFADGWLGGVSELAGDVPAAARRIAELDGAPEALVLLERLGQIEPASLRDNAQVMGLSGRGAVTLETLFRHAWRLLRERGVLSSPAPEGAPVTTGVVEDLVRSGSSVDPVAAAEPSRPTGETNAPGRGPVTLFAWSPAAEAAEADVVSSIGFVAGVFPPLGVRVAARDRRQGQHLVETVRQRFDLPEDRVQLGRAAAGRGRLAVEVLSAP